MASQFRTARKWITKRVAPDYTNQLDLFSEAAPENIAAGHSSYGAKRRSPPRQSAASAAWFLRYGNRWRLLTLLQLRGVNRRRRISARNEKQLACSLRNLRPPRPVKFLRTGGSLKEEIAQPTGFSTSSQKKDLPEISE
jgi:hypothetical protein